MIRIKDARRYYSETGVHGFDHVLRVLALAERIARAKGADLVIVRAAVLLHDIARSVEDEEARQPLISQPDKARYSPIDEFRQKLALLRERMTTTTGRALAEERHAFMEVFFGRPAAKERGDA